MRVLIADDHPLFRQGVSSVLANTPDNEVIAEAGSGEEAVQMACNLLPDLVLMDIQMPDLNGIEATRKILSKCRDIYIIIITMFEDDTSVFSAMQAGARGYVLKDAEKEDILRAVRAIAKGEVLFSSGVASRMIDYFAQGEVTQTVVASTLFPELTSRESEVLFLLSKGASNSEVAETLGLSNKTVYNYVANILNKLQVSDRQESRGRFH
ncbi:LuxR family transcriptional regulator [Bacillus coahuilensis m2-6]|uniref:LuxR family transcriptional regulator n=1 Tax=Bacillus coahuilensis p1.1.43 TaxID=1150625 RepID=A0A147K567_9BACI|nr:LuxR family transcriptional regulator [Bacillus coahuilensis m2-6]KUP04746.1 LuxR family transcriptional regulator [Bacillus coahuilensis p1.1.43]